MVAVYGNSRPSRGARRPRVVVVRLRPLFREHDQ